MRLWCGIAPDRWVFFPSTSSPPNFFKVCIPIPAIRIYENCYFRRFDWEVNIERRLAAIKAAGEKIEWRKSRDALHGYIYLPGSNM